MLPLSFTARRANLEVFSRLALLASLLWLVASCSSTPTPATKVTDTGEQDVPGVDDQQGDATDVPDVGGADLIAELPTVIDAGSDTKDTADTSGICTSDNQCQGKITVKSCQVAVCKAGKCIADTKPGSCCDDSACPLKDCSDAKCNLATSLCEYAPQFNCCKEQKKPLDTSFEGGTLDNFVASSVAANGNVTWHTETKRAHSGKSSLYFGNDCHVYDNSITVDKGCAGNGGTGTGIQTSLKTPEVLLGDSMMLHYWLWLDTEPTYMAKGLPKGDCSATPCSPGSSCVDLGKDQGGSQCIAEKDVVTVKVSGEVQPVWYSTAIGKTTSGKWQHFVVNLAKYGGQSVTIEWAFSTTNGAKNNYEGIYLDDVKIETLCADIGVTCGDGVGTCAVDGASPCDDQSCTNFVNVDKLGVCFHDKKPDCCVGSIDCEDNNDCTKDMCVIPTGDTTGACANTPNGDNPACCAESNTFSDGFDAGMSTWQAKGGNSKAVTWHINSTCGSNAGPGLAFSNAAGDSYDDPTLGAGKGPQGTICTAPIAVKLGTVYNLASFKVKMQTEWSGQQASAYKNPPTQGGCAIDQLTVGVFDAGQLQKPLWTSDAIFGTTEGKLLGMQVDLDAYGGKSVQLCFTFDACDSTANNYTGVCIDDVKVDIACEPNPCQDDTMCPQKACNTATCNLADHACSYAKVAGCCIVDKDCDDADSCTTDTCAAGTCSNVSVSPTCCSAKSPLASEGMEAGTLPTGWKVKNLTGNAQGGFGKPYDTTIKWNVSALKAKTGTYSLYFGNNGTYNAGANVPAGVASSPVFTVPANGSSLVTFDLYLSTEWDGAIFNVQPPSFVIDRMRVGLTDPAQVDPTKATEWLWSSYDIAGTTNTHWESVVLNIPDTWKGKTAKLTFEFDAGTETKNTFEGAYVDNVAVSTVCDKPGCLGDKECQPSAPDSCKKFFCAMSVDPASSAKSYACSSDFKPGTGCCVPDAALPIETAESGLVSWSASGTSSVAKWQAIAHKYLTGNSEIYFGNPTVFNYDDTSLGSKGVKGNLTSKPFTLSNDLKKGAVLSFNAWIDVEQSWETFEIYVTYSSPTIKQLLWSKKTGMVAADYKAVIAKQVDLSKYKGQGAMVISFEFDSQDNLNNDKYQGIFLDDIQVAEPCL